MDIKPTHSIALVRNFKLILIRPEIYVFIAFLFFSHHFSIPFNNLKPYYENKIMWAYERVRVCIIFSLCVFQERWKENG